MQAAQHLAPGHPPQCAVGRPLPADRQRQERLAGWMGQGAERWGSQQRAESGPVWVVPAARCLLMGRGLVGYLDRNVESSAEQCDTIVWVGSGRRVQEGQWCR